LKASKTITPWFKAETISDKFSKKRKDNKTSSHIKLLSAILYLMKIVTKPVKQKPVDGLKCDLQVSHHPDLIMQETSFIQTICGIDLIL
jgi:hypothetical protein